MTRPERRGLLVIAVAVAFAVSGCSDDGGPPTSGTPRIEVRDATIAVPAGRNTAIYFVVENDGDGDDHLVEVRTDAGTRIELHETRADDDGLMRMHPLDGVDVPVGEVVAFEPGGRHVMVFDARELTEGDTVAVELVFDRSGPVAVDAVVRSYADLVDG